MTNINFYFTVISIFKQNQHPSTNVYLHLWTKGQQLFLTFWYRLVWFPSVFKQYCVYEKKPRCFIGVYFICGQQPTLPVLQLAIITQCFMSNLIISVID